MNRGEDAAPTGGFFKAWDVRGCGSRLQVLFIDVGALRLCPAINRVQARLKYGINYRGCDPLLQVLLLVWERRPRRDQGIPSFPDGQARPFRRLGKAQRTQQTAWFNTPSGTSLRSFTRPTVTGVPPPQKNNTRSRHRFFGNTHRYFSASTEIAAIPPGSNAPTVAGTTARQIFATQNYNLSH
jgi:hypothetical protein